MHTQNWSVYHLVEEDEEVGESRRMGIAGREYGNVGQRRRVNALHGKSIVDGCAVSAPLNMAAVCGGGP